MARTKKPKVEKKIPKPSSIVAILAFCGGCEKTVQVEARFEVETSCSGRTICRCADYCYCEYPETQIENKRLEFTCPSCQYYSTVYIT